MLLEQFHELLQVTQMAGQTIEPVHNDHINAAIIDIGQQFLQARSFQMTARDPFVLVEPVARLPALAPLRGDQLMALLLLREDLTRRLGVSAQDLTWLCRAIERGQHGHTRAQTGTH
jgi:hypothetical protein